MVEMFVKNSVQQAIRAQFEKFREENGHEPLYVDCRIEWTDDHSSCDVTIKLTCDTDEKEDDAIFYYCDSVEDLESLTEKGCEDFIVTEVYSFEDKLQL